MGLGGPCDSRTVPSLKGCGASLKTGKRGKVWEGRGEQGTEGGEMRYLYLGISGDEE